jgi:Fe2+ transport system protein B
MDVENVGKIKGKKRKETRNKIVLLCDNPSPMNLMVLKTLNNEVSRLVDINHCTHVCGYFLCSTRLFIYSFVFGKKITESYSNYIFHTRIN